MRTHLRLLILPCLSVAFASCQQLAGPNPGPSPFPDAPPETVGVDAGDLQTLKAQVASRVAEQKPVGAEVLIIRHGKTVLHEAFGFQDREAGRKLHTDSIFRIRSMTKPIIATAVLMLCEEGRIALTDRVATHLASFDNERSREVTIEELLTHTAGLRDHDNQDIGLSKAPHEFSSLRALADEIGAIGPLLPRGSFQYSSSGTVTLAALVAEVTNMPVEQFVQQRIFEPLGMTDTHVRFAPGCAWAERLCSTYEWSGEKLRFERYWHPGLAQRFPYFRGAGGVYTTTSDYARFLTMWMHKGTFGGTRLLREATVEAALRPHPAGNYGHHWLVPETQRKGGMPSAFLHQGADSTIGLALPAQDTVVLYFTQSRGPGIRSEFRAALSRVRALAADTIVDLNGTTLREHMPEPSQMPAGEAGLYVGRYRGSILVDGVERLAGKFHYEVTRTEHGLRGNLTRDGNLSDGPLTGHDLAPLGNGTFLPGRLLDGKLLEIVRGTSVRFVTDEPGSRARRVEIQGRPTRIQWRLQRVE